MVGLREDEVHIESGGNQVVVNRDDLLADTAPRQSEPIDAEVALGLTILWSSIPDLAGLCRPLGVELTIGRVDAPGVDLVIPEGTVSRRHATILRRERPAMVEIVDHESMNGTFVDGVRVTNQLIAPGNIIGIGDTFLEIGALDPPADGNAGDARFIGRSGPFRRLIDAIDEVAPSTLSVLIEGETGTGKELAARRIHERSGRTGPLVTLNCAAIPEQLLEAQLFGHTRGAFTGASETRAGLLDEADGGTLLLDEIGLLPLALQPKLLRVLEEREFFPVGSVRPRTCDVRFIAATNAALATELERGQFRRDLYGRLAEYVVQVPSLRERRLDIAILLTHFVETYAPDKAFSMKTDFVEALLLQPWKMNVRELRSLARRLALVEGDLTGIGKGALSQDMLQASAASEEAVPQPALPSAGTEPSKSELRELFDLYRGNVSRIAQYCGTSRAQIYRLLRRYDLDLAELRKRFGGGSTD